MAKKTFASNTFKGQTWLSGDFNGGGQSPSFVEPAHADWQYEGYAKVVSVFDNWNNPVKGIGDPVNRAIRVNVVAGSVALISSVVTLGTGSATVGTVNLGSETTTGISGVGSKSLTNVAAQMTSASITATKGVIVKAPASNGGTVYLGKDNTVTANSNPATDGIPLAPGDSVTLPINNANLVWAIASSGSGNQIFFMAI